MIEIVLRKLDRVDEKVDRLLAQRAALESHVAHMDATLTEFRQSAEARIKRLERMLRAPRTKAAAIGAGAGGFLVGAIEIARLLLT